MLMERFQIIGNDNAKTERAGRLVTINRIESSLLWSTRRYGGPLLRIPPTEPYHARTTEVPRPGPGCVVGHSERETVPAAACGCRIGTGKSASRRLPPPAAGNLRAPCPRSNLKTLTAAAALAVQD